MLTLFEDNYNIVRDCFETESVNMMKYMLLVAKKQNKFQYISLTQSIHTTMRTAIRNNNTQIVCQPYWFVRNSLEKLADLEEYWANATCNL